MKPSKSCSKLDIAERETIAFKSKKAPAPKRTGSIKNNANSNSNKTVKAPPAAATSPQKQSQQQLLKPQQQQKPSLKKPSLIVKRGGNNDNVPILTKTGSSEDDSSPIFDSVEVSFQEKLRKADKQHHVMSRRMFYPLEYRLLFCSFSPFQKELRDLEAFEMLEEAACDSSFCSTSSKVKSIISKASSNGNIMPSPISKLPSATSTPKSKILQIKKFDAV